MNKYLELLTNKMYELYDAYEDHAFNSYVNNQNKYRLVVKFTEYNKIGYLLFEKNKVELVDEVYIDFEGDRDLYEAIALRIFVKALGNVIVHKLGCDMYFNPKHKPYILVIVEDERIINLLDQMIENQENENLNLEHKIVKNTSNIVKRYKCDWSFLSQIEDRVALTKELFRRW